MRKASLILAAALAATNSCDHAPPSPDPIVTWNQVSPASEGLLAEASIAAEHFLIWIQDNGVVPDIPLVANAPHLGPEFGVSENPGQPHHMLNIAATDEFNTCWIRVFVANGLPELEPYDFSGCVRFRVTGESASIGDIDSSPTNGFIIPLESGDYSLLVCAKNVRKYPTDAEADLDDDAFKRMPFESYDLFFVTKQAEKFGEIKMLEE